MDLESLLPLIWAAIIGFAVALYVILDGFDLGIGILFPFARDDAERDRMLSAVAPFWDGNETWLVLGGGGLLVAFPRAYAIVMPAFYLPIMVMLLALVFRGVTFEFRGMAQSRRFWNFVFAAGSTLAGFCQGLILGGLVQGVKIENGAYAGGAFDWATPFGVLCGLGVVTGYALLGTTWLMMKTDGDMADRAAAKARVLLIAVLFFMVAVSIFTPLEFPRIAQRWFTLPNLYYLLPIPFLTALVALAEWYFIAARREAAAFLATIALFLLGYVGLAISTYPYILPPDLTIRAAAAAPASQTFMLIGTLVLLPFILGYTALTYWLFRGKVGARAAYH
ncbi:MAG TPA: cytochrome d ubiquinol oxidase subunit II [Xanthobacteraceae bacterium]|nr:cytochrome d ubiquinol oxidase subunit II [Xanthobacteraceae bacterium]